MTHPSSRQRRHRAANKLTENFRCSLCNTLRPKAQVSIWNVTGKPKRVCDTCVNIAKASRTKWRTLPNGRFTKKSISMRAKHKNDKFFAGQALTGAGAGLG